MKKTIIGFLILTMFILNGCNEGRVNPNSGGRFTHAIIKIEDGYERVEVERWTDLDDGLIQIVTKDGRIYLSNSLNVVLYSN